MPSLFVLTAGHAPAERHADNAPIYRAVTGTVIPLSEAEVVFGRDAEGLGYHYPGAQVVHLPSTSANKIHATLRRDGTLYTITDAGSRNGTRVNGNSIRVPVFLRDGDEIGMGEVVFAFRDETGWEGFTLHGLDKVTLCTLLSLLSSDCPEREWNRFLPLIAVVYDPAGGSRYLLVVRHEQVAALASVIRMSEVEFGRVATRWSETEELRGHRGDEVSAMLRRLAGLADSAVCQQRHLLLWQGSCESA